MVARKHESVIFMGAEALLRRDITEVIRKGRDLGLQVSAFTNGRVLARPGFVEELAEAGLSSMQVSVHYADADSFARGTGASPRHFDEVWRGLENVARFNRGAPAPGIVVRPKTVLFGYNLGRLREIVDLLRQSLGDSFRGYMISCVSPCETKRPEYLLKPIDARRSEVSELLDGWREPFDPVFSMVPLSMIPGREHLSYDVRFVADPILVESNFDDKSTLADLHDFVGNFRENPYRWQCRDCALLALCSSFRCLWERLSFGPRRDQAFRPVRDTTASDVLRRVAVEDRAADPDASVAAMEGRVRAKLAVLESVEVPEHALAQALRELHVPGAPRVEVFCEGLRALSIGLCVDGAPTTLHLRHAHTGDVIEFPVRYFNVVVDASSSANIHGLAPVLRQISALPIPSLEAWRGQHGFNERWARILESAWGALGEILWPGIGRVGPWRTQGVRMPDDTGLVLELREPGGALVAVRLYAQVIGEHTPAAKEPDLAVETPGLRCFWVPGHGGRRARSDEVPAAFMAMLAKAIARRGARPEISSGLAGRLLALRRSGRS
jgi:MoaA/NifB/PqqE/SkfB family radical SAM enzyme